MRYNIYTTDNFNKKTIQEVVEVEGNVLDSVLKYATEKYPEAHMSGSLIVEIDWNAERAGNL